MNVERHNNWRDFAIERWPDKPYSWIQMTLGEKMKSVLDLMMEEKDSTDDLIRILKKLPRRDVIYDLHQMYPDDHRLR
jgi:hypothetical protein